MAYHEKGSEIAIEKPDSDVVRVFMEEEFNKIPKDKMWNLIPSINSRQRIEMNVLRTWEKHFKGLKIPYKITQRGKTLTLWKERRVDQFGNGI